MNSTVLWRFNGAEYSEDGAVGDPELATAEKGAEIFERLCEELATILREAHNQTRA